MRNRSRWSLEDGMASENGHVFKSTAAGSAPNNGYDIAAAELNIDVRTILQSHPRLTEQANMSTPLNGLTTALMMLTSTFTVGRLGDTGGSLL